MKPELIQRGTMYALCTSNTERVKVERHLDNRSTSFSLHNKNRSTSRPATAREVGTFRLLQAAEKSLRAAKKKSDKLYVILTLFPAGDTEPETKETTRV